MKTWAISLFAIFFYTHPITAADLPSGFSQDVLDKVMEGKIPYQSVINTRTELKFIQRAYFNKVSPRAYSELVRNFKKYEIMFKRRPYVVKKGRQTFSDAKKGIYDYRLDVRFYHGPFPIPLDPEGRVTIVEAKDAVSNWKLTNVLKNFKDKFKFAKQDTILIPYEKGILVQDTVHLELKKDDSSAKLAKEKVTDFLKLYISTFRKELKGDIL